MSEQTPRWFTVTEKKSGRRLYARKGFGLDGSRVAVYDFDRHPMDTGRRHDAGECRELYTLGAACSQDKSDEIESRFGWELNR